MITTINSNAKARSSSINAIKSSSKSFEGWYCASGIFNLNIYPDGTLYGNACRSGGSYGNIYEEYSLPDVLTICDRKTCYCGSDIRIPKGISITSLNAVLAIPHKKYEFTQLNDELIALKGWDNVLTIDWNLGTRCNYDCSYCPSFVHDNHSPHLSLNRYTNAFESLYDKIGHHKNILLSFLGGEPTLNPAYEEIIRYSKRDNVHIVTTTNGTAPLYKLALYKSLGTLNISIHQDYYSSKLGDKIKSLAPLPGKLSISYMLQPNKTEELYLFLKSIQDYSKHLILEICPLVDRTSDNILLHYSQEELDIINGRTVL